MVQPIVPSWSRAGEPVLPSPMPIRLSPPEMNVPSTSGPPPKLPVLPALMVSSMTLVPPPCREAAAAGAGATAVELIAAFAARATGTTVAGERGSGHSHRAQVEDAGSGVAPVAAELTAARVTPGAARCAVGCRSWN